MIQKREEKFSSKTQHLPNQQTCAEGQSPQGLTPDGNFEQGGKYWENQDETWDLET